jgi:hypothetical protein
MSGRGFWTEGSGGGLFMMFYSDELIYFSGEEGLEG